MKNRPIGTRLAFAVLCCVPLLAACESHSPEETLWRKHCADCHGIDGSGNTARYMGNAWADLLDNSWKSASGDEYTITAVVREGVFGQMPANTELSDQEVTQIVDWLYSLRGETR